MKGVLAIVSRPRPGRRTKKLGFAVALPAVRTATYATWWLVLSASWAHATAQERVVVSDAPACDCHLEVELVTTLQDLDGRAGLSRPLVVERAGDARYLVVPTTRQGALLEFDESGAFRRTIGRPGQGPGEFGVILAIRPGAGDSTLVMDAGNRRLAILDAALNVARTARLPVIGGWFGAVGEGGLLVLSGIPGRTAESLDRVFLLDSSLSIERSFMPAPARGLDTRIESLRRRLAVAKSGVVAVSHWSRYAIEVWRADGTHEKTLVREVDWFPADEVGRDGSSGPISPVQEAPRIDEDGRLWTVTHVRDEDWEESFGPARTRAGRSATGLSKANRDDLYDSVIEVVDLESGRLIASRRVDAHVAFISNAGHAASYREDRIGYPFVDVWRFEVVER